MPIFIESHRYELGDLLFDVAIFERRREFYAAWFCRQCLSRSETDHCKDQASAKHLAENAIDAHLYEKHHPGPESGG